MTNRRDFLKSASLLTFGALAASKGFAASGVDATTTATPKAAKAGKNLGLQLYSLGGEFFANPAETLKKIKAAGYQQLELAFYSKGGFASFGRNAGSPLSAADLKKMCDDAGIGIRSSHLTPNNLDRGEKYGPDTKGKILDFWKSVIDDHKMFGCEYIVQPSLPTINSKEDAQNVADVFNSVGELLRQNGIKFGYHNHSNEFNKVVPGGTEVIPYNQRMRPGQNGGAAPEAIEKVFIDNTDPQNVLFELDCYWTVMGQQDPVEWIKTYKDRIQLLHIKDFIVIGASGAMNFENIFNAFYANGHKHWFVEIEDINSGKQVQRAEESAKYLLGRDFVK